MKTKTILVCGTRNLFFALAAIFALAFIACGAEPEPEPKHVHNYTWTVITPATCIATGVESGVCKLDPSHTTTREIAIDLVNGHNYGAWTQTSPADETTDGAEGSVCSNNPQHTGGTRPLYATGTTGLAFTLISDGDNEGTYSVKKGTVTTGAVFIPAYWRGDSSNYEDYLPVTEIDSGAFASTSITGITIPEGVTTIGEWAFNSCTNLASITIPASVTAIGEKAFLSTSASVTFAADSQLKTIGPNAFERTGFTSIIIPDSVTSIGNEAFTYSNLTSITIPDSVTSIGESAFRWSYDLTTVTIPDSVTSIGERAFQGCNKLADITIPSRVTAIRAYMFQGCTSLASITIPEGVRQLNGAAFNGCNLSSIIIPSTVNQIDNAVFQGNENLISVTFNCNIGVGTFSTGTSTQAAFPGDLRDKYFAQSASTRIGRYTTTAPVSTSSVWTKQP